MNLLHNPNRDLFIFCPSCGKKALSPKSMKSFVCTACSFSFYLNCAAAAMAVIQDNKGRLLVTIRKRDPGKGGLDLPGGFAEPGEGIETCLAREIKEELCLDVTSMTYLCSFANDYLYKSVKYPITDVAFEYRVKNFDAIAAQDDIAGFQFIAREDLDPAKFAMHSAQQVVRRFIEKQKSTKAMEK